MKKSSKRRMTTVVLAMIVIISIIAGCTSSTSSPTTAMTTATTAAPTTTAGTTSESTTAKLQYSLPYTGSPVTLQMLGWVSYSQLDPTNKFGKWVQEKLGNITLNVDIPASEDANNQKIQLALSSGDMPDMMVIRKRDDFMANYGDGSRTINLLDYAQYMPQYMERREQFPHLSSYDQNGRTYIYFPCWYDGTGETWVMNQTVMDKYGITSVPKTYSEMKTIMDQVLPQEPGMCGILMLPWGNGFQIPTFTTMFNDTGSEGSDPTKIYWDYSLNKWYFALTQKEAVFKKSIAEMALGYQKRYLHPDFLTMDGNMFGDIFNNGKSMFTQHYIEVFTSNWIKQNMTYEISFMQSPVEGEGVKPSISTPYWSDNTGWCLVVSKTSKYPELCCSILELFGSNDMAQAYSWGWEGDTYTISNGVKQYTDAFKAMDGDTVNKTYGIKPVPYWFFPYISTCYAKDGVTAGWSDAQKQAQSLIAKGLMDGTFITYYGAQTPNFDEKVAQVNNTALTAISTYIWENITAFILGNKPMSEWDSFVAGVSAYGDIDKILDDYNNAPQKALPATQSQRQYIDPLAKP